MKITIRELEIEFEAETQHERLALAKLRDAGKIVEIKTEWEPGNKLILVVPDPNNWGT